MMTRPILIIIFLFLVSLTLVAGYFVIEVYEYEEIFDFNILQITALAMLTLPLFLVEVDKESQSIQEGNHDEAFDLSNRDPKSELKVVQDMAKQMLKTINEHIEKPCTVMGFKETGHTYEIEWLINEEDFLNSYQEVAIIPYEKVHELEYWQEITRIIIRNNKVRTKPEQAGQQNTEQRKQAIRQKMQNKKRSRTKSE